MLSFEEVKKNAKKQKERDEKRNSSSSTSSNSWDSVKQKARDYLATDSASGLRDISKWLNGVKSVGDRASDYYFTGKYVTPSKEIGDELDKYIADAGAIKSYINANRGSFDNYDEMLTTYNNALDYLQNLRSGINASDKYYSQWESEDAYIKGASENREDRQQRYESNKKRIEEIKAALPWNAKTFLPTVVEKWFLSDEDDALVDELEALEADNAQYERGEGGYISKTVDDYFKVTQNFDFSAGSQNRDYNNPTQEAIAKADVMNDSSTWYWDANGVYRDAFGNELAVDETGTWYNPVAQNTKVEDKLALYLNTPEDERVQAGIDTMGEDGIWTSVMKEGYGGGWEYLTEQEIGIYYYLLNENPESAYKYLSDMETELNRRRTREQTGEWYDSYDDANLLEKIALNIATVPSKFVSSLAGSIDNAVNTLQGNEINPYSIAHGGMHFSQTVRGATAADMDKTGFKIPVLDYSLGDIYQVGMSRLDSALATGLTGGSGTVILGMGAAQNEAYRLYQAGASPEQITWGALTAGAAEAVFEYVSFDKLVRLGDIKTIGQWVKSALIQGGIEASEEFFTEVSNIITNAVIMGSQSDLDKLYEANGNDWLKTGLSLVQQTAQAAFGGFLGGFGAGGTQGGKTYINNQVRFAETGSTITSADGGVDALKTLADKVAGVSDTKMQKTLGRHTASVDKKATDRRVGRLYDTVQTANNLNHASANQADIAKSLQRKGFNADTANDIAEALVAQYNGQTLTRAQERLLKSVNDNPVVKNAISNIMTNDLSTMGQRSQNIRDFQNDVKRGIAYKAITETIRQNTTAEQFTPAGEYEVSDKGKAINTETDEEIEIKGVADIGRGKLILELADGTTIDSKSVSFASESDALIYEAIANLGDNINYEAANKLIAKYDGSNASVFARGIAQAYTYGFYGLDRSEMTGEKSLSAELTKEQRNFAYGLGEKYRSVKDLADKAKGRARKAPGKQGVYYRGKDGAATDIRSYLKQDRRVLNEMQTTGIEFMEKMSKMMGVRFNIFESWEENGKKYYLDENGKKTEGNPNGFYDPNTGEIYIDLFAGNDFQGTMLFTVAHELTHFMRQWSPEHFTKISKLVFSHAGFKGSVSSLVADKMRKSKGRLNYDAALEEVVADGMETILKDGKVAEFMADVKKTDSKVWAKLKEWFKNFADFLKKMVDAYSGESAQTVEGKKVADFSQKLLNQIEQIWAEGAVAAGENYQSSLTPGEEGTIVNENGDPVAHATEDGSVQLSMRTYEEEGRAAFRKYLEKCVKSKRLTQGEMQEMMDGIEDIYKTCKEFKDKYAPFSSWSDAAVVRDTYGKPVFSVVTPNGDYKMNLDFSLVCKKRRTLDAVFNEMSRRGIIDDFELGQKSVVKINEIIRKYGLETACALCFVDAKRFRQASMADSFTRLYNELVESLVPEDQRGSIEHFNFSGYDTIAKVENGIHTWDASKLDFTHLDEVMKNYGDGTVEYKAAKYIKSNAEGRKLLLRGDFMSSQGFDAVKTQNPDVLKLYNSKKGTGGPKAAFGDVQYMNEVIKKARFWTAKKAYAVGGIRIQSFSDYVPRMVFDYVQMIYDLAATKLPAHAYTKEALFVKQFGLTGVKINMSLIPAIAEGGIAPGLDANGNYVWAGESFDFETAKEIQNAEGYSENCGTICVGVSYQHILKLLSDPDIRMVIPYHKSGLNPIVAHMNKIAEFTDYTTLKTNPGGCQNTMDKNGNKVEVDFNFNEALRKTGDPKATVRQYLNWCAENEYTPRFAEFAWHENYYKLIEDFTLYDKDGKYVPQRGVKAVFPNESSAFGSMKSLIQEGLQEDAIVEGKRDSNLSAIVDEIQETLPKTEAEISEEQVAQADRDLEADTKFSERDSNYLDAVKRGDIETAQKMVDGAASSAGYTTVGYHGSRTPGFTVVDKYSWLWSARNEAVANEYGTHDEVESNGKPHNKKGVYAMRYNLGNNLEVYADGASWGDLPVTEDEYPGVYVNEYNEITTNAMAEWAEMNGYDSITFVDVDDGGLTTVDVVFDPNRDAKSADPVTYDDNGNVIPLSERFNQANDDIRYSVRDYAEQVDEVKNKTHDPSNHVYMGTTPTGIVNIIDLPKLPMLVTTNHIYSMAVSKQQAKAEKRYNHNFHYHDLGWDVVKALPVYINKPVLIIKSNTDPNDASFVVVTAQTDSDGRPIMAAIKPNGVGNYFNIEFPSNVMLSGYGRTGIQGYVARAKTENRILYANKKNSQKLKNTKGVQFSNNILASDYSANLAQFQKIVKSKFAGTIFENGGLPKFSDRADESNENSPVYDNVRYSERSSTIYIKDGHTTDGETVNFIDLILDGKKKGETRSHGNLTRKWVGIAKDGYVYGMVRMGDPKRIDKNSPEYKDSFIEGTEYDLKDNEQKYYYPILETEDFRDNPKPIEKHGNYGTFTRYQDRTEDSVSNRSLLANAFESVAKPNEIPKIQEYKAKVALINAEEQKLRELNEQIKELSFAKGKRDTKKISELRFDATQAANRINTYDKQLLRLEASKPLQDVLEREKKRAYKKAEQRGKEALAEYKSQVLAKQKETAEKWRESRKAAVSKARETSENRDARAKLQKLVLDTVKWISYPAKTDVKCPDILKKPYESFLQCIDLSSKRLANGGEATKNDLRLANAMGSLATALDKIMISQDPTQDVDKVLDTGYLDLPVDFVQKLRDMTENIKSMMVEGEYVVNTMTAAEVRQLSQMIRTLNHSIKTMSKLYANLRFANVEALGVDTMEFMDALGEIEKTGGMGDFVKWDNALPYYAFKRFGKGGESVFEGLMDAQDKLAFLAKEIFEFRDKAWTSKEASEWSEDTHTIELPKGGSLTLTTADAMSIYCLSRRDQGLQHLLGGGTRVLGLQKGSKKAKDSRSLLTTEDISAINSSLTDRQRAVAEAIQEFMSTVCSEWGNEISMKRFLTREFTEKFYFPIESNDENLPVKDPAAQQSDLFRLLNISATKPLTPGANNEVIIRNIFDVFTGHASDMARLNAFGMGLLDYMKWLNYREKTANIEGQIKVRGVRKSMQGAYGDSAMRYVLNLVKDVNGRTSDGGDPNILMKWMRAAKTASVGNSLRVATLQVTSYPRAALVLSPKSLALGLTKMPNIEKAKKYCGIALWKSFGFYDTNISRSIEDQMKGVTDVKQKLIELSLKGAELGDAITWGALWNACEYEVAQTTKNNVGSEEFYQEVGKKLREVVYRTQVVDSNLTRSQIMRSKRGMAQEAAAFMSEPTLSANILMDAGFEFGLEKRRTGSAKAAWTKTGSYIARAVAVYSIGQLAAALMEGLWDAWRDDDDEEFGQKFLDEFIENLALDLVPFNKIPIVSDVFEGALAMFDVGFYSADKMSSAWITQALSAADAWKDVFGGKSSTTAYNAIYKTTRALSSYFGVSVSGAMREVVALWNNTAGAYDSTLKIRQYDLSEADLGVELYEALISGNTRQADSLKAQFDDVESVQAALRKAIMDNYSSGGINRDTALRHLVEFSGMEEDDAYWKVEEWEYEKEFDDEFRKYNEFYEAVQTGKNLKAVTKEYTDHGVDAKTLASQITSYFKPLYKEMSKAERAALKGYLLNAYALLGYDRDKKSKDIDKWLED